MAARVRVPLPRNVVAGYFVLAAAAGADPDVVISRSAAGLPPSARQVLADHIGDLRIRELLPLQEAPIPPAGLLLAHGASAQQVERVANAGAGWALLLRRSPHAAVAAESAVRCAAVLLSEALEGVVIDAAIPRLLRVDAAAAGTPVSTDWHSFTHVAGRLGTDISTRGLARFGLPELAARDVPPDVVPAWHAILSGVAHLVLVHLQQADQGSSHPELDLPAEMMLSVRDVAGAYGQRVDAGDPTLRRETVVRLALGSRSAAERRITVSSATDAAADLFGGVAP